ncbi:DEAD/DEAH box helicase [Pseudomonas oryzihabitans]|uniref:DEAD/DEAH box helicase n=1 Tax=Pseudomonas oryzihabitans TaxID=47885 RepID=UPI00135E0AC1|nr:DEAD/DEAH box helicase [Pseudomonas oryzihabitans]MXS20575.1 helicase [Pseudomonas oryzihabitans]
MALRFERLKWQDWKGAFTERNYERGRRLALDGLVQLRSAAKGQLYAECHSPAGPAYRQAISLRASETAWRVDARCTCPVGRNCKHAAAALIELERLQRSEAELPATPVANPELPQPVLTLGSHTQIDYDRHIGKMRPTVRHRAALAFAYGPRRLFGALPRTPDASYPTRQLQAEQRWRQTLLDHGLRLATRRSAALPEDSGEMFELPDDPAWLRFVQQVIPDLREAGWQIEAQPEFTFDLTPVAGWYGHLEEVQGHTAADAQFDVELGIRLGQRRVSLIPLLIDAIRREPSQYEPAMLAKRADDEPVLLRIDPPRVTGQQGRVQRVAVPLGRLKPILQILGELYATDRLSQDRALRLPRLDAARLAELDERLPLEWEGGERLRSFAERLRSYAAEPVVLPDTLHAELRPYQREGVAWLQALRELDVGGILADDMGLGKTLQTLAHILVEQAAGRLTAPALIVMPTSLIPNWQDEIARFAPGLRVLTLQGSARSSRFERIPEHDVVLTTYALLPRDAERLASYDFHLQVLDEAQSIKNAATKAAQAARHLRARHRLCLTGTPLENHLGELWSQFHFLMPGWLGDEKGFKQAYRIPVEREGDVQRLAALKARVWPFMLRRTKQRVASELPPKTEIIQLVELSTAQRERYEDLRLLLDERVRAEIARQGIGRSQLLILDALLRLRQVCCDLRLVPNEDDSVAKPSAKLAALNERLDALLPGGSRVLVFSQFTSMLDLIATDLDQRGIEYVTLTGETRDRRTPVQRFQNGEVPVFLLSLKAGGSGLNLTAADTVIHFDPWWNPAAEQQASDRAYRIGQDRPVFVYKLIARGTLEERIQQLQQEKARLSAGILSENSGDWRLTESDLAQLLAPLDR